MRKLLLLFLGIILIPAFSIAGPAYPGLIKEKQPDGTVIEFYSKGDEKVNWLESPDGHSLLVDNQKRIVYAILDSKGDMIPSDIVYRGTSTNRAIDPRAGTIPKKLFYSKGQVDALLQLWEIKDEYQPKVQTFAADGYEPIVEGTIRVLCVLVDFPDIPFTYTKADFEKLLNMQNYTPAMGNPSAGSVRDYFKETSYGKVDVQFDIYGVYRTPENSEVYKAGGSQRMDMSSLGAWFIPNKLALEPDLDLSRYVDEGTNTINKMHIIFAGEKQRYLEDPNGFAWPHQGFFHGSNSFKYIINNKEYHFKNYSCSPEIANKYNNTPCISTIGIICHELSHLIFRIPDYYDTNYQFEGTGIWDLMAEGSQNSSAIGYSFSGSYPAHINMYEKIRLGWIQPQILKTSTDISMLNSAENPVVYLYKRDSKFPSPKAGFAYPVKDIDGEFFILENKQWRGFDAGLPDYGLLIYRAHKDLKHRTIITNDVNGSHPQKLYPVLAACEYAIPTSDPKSYYYFDTTQGLYGRNEWYSSSEFTDETVPSATTWEGLPTNQPLTNIKDENGIVTFTYQNLSYDKHIYHPDDKEFIRDIIRNSDELGKTGLLPSDTIEWYETEDWVAKINSDKGLELAWVARTPFRRLYKFSLLTLNYGNIEYKGKVIDFSTLEELQILKLNCYNMRSLESLNVSQNKLLREFYIEYSSKTKINTLDLDFNIYKNTLESVFIESGSFGVLDLSQCTKLKNIKIRYSEFPSLKIPANSSILEKVDISSNYMKFSDLPDISYYKDICTYSPQYITIMDTISASQPIMIDLSKEANIRGTNTQFEWYIAYSYSQEEPITSPIQNNNGVFTFMDDVRGRTIGCKMTNDLYPELTAMCQVFVEAKEMYHPDDKEFLRQIIRQVNDMSKLGLTSSDTINWYNSEEWVDKIQRTNDYIISWKYDQMKRINYFYCWDKDIQEIDVSPLSELTILEIGDYRISNITKLNIGNNSKLQSISLNRLENLTSNIDISNCTRLSVLKINNCMLSECDLSNNSNIEYLTITELYHNPMDELNLENCTKLKELNLYRAYLSSLKLPNKLPFLGKADISSNYLRFNTLPDLSNYNGTWIYSPQSYSKEDPSKYIGESFTVDLSDQYIIRNTTTEYKWSAVSQFYPFTYTPITPTSSNNGVFTFSQEFTSGMKYKNLLCEMTNSLYPDLVLNYTVYFGEAPTTRSAITFSSEDNTPTATVYPTMLSAREAINIKVPDLDSPTKVEIFTQSGLLVSKHENVEISGKVQAPSATGLYILRIASKGKYESHKIIVK